MSWMDADTLHGYEDSEVHTQAWQWFKEHIMPKLSKQGEKLDDLREKAFHDAAWSDDSDWEDELFDQAKLDSELYPPELDEVLQSEELSPEYKKAVWDCYEQAMTSHWM